MSLNQQYNSISHIIIQSTYTNVEDNGGGRFFFFLPLYVKYVHTYARRCERKKVRHELNIHSENRAKNNPKISEEDPRNFRSA